MPYDRFLIAPITTGLQIDLRPWLIPDDAFARLKNVYVFRGRLRKRFGSTLMGSGYSSNLVAQLYSRLRIQVNTTDGSGNASGTVPGSVFPLGQLFSIGDEIFTVYQTGIPADTLTTGASTVHTYNTSTGAYVFMGATALTAVYFYPATPVMGLTQYDVGFITNQPAYAFDTQFAYKFSGGAWARSGTGANPLWHGTDKNFFWTENYYGATANIVTMFVTNFNAAVGATSANDDPLWYTSDGSTWSKFFAYFFPNGGAPQSGPFVQTARIIVAFKNRLLLLNTIENSGTSPYSASTNTQFPQRCRYSFIGSPLAPNAWYEYGQRDSSGNIAAGANFIDATTEQQIISAEFIKDRLIVYFERSTWEIVYTGNQIDPFRWQKINTDLGSEGTFSTVPFDKVVLTMGTTGVHACNGSNVERIDTKIPDQVFEIANKNEGVLRVAGIRDYYTEMVYWTFPSDNENPDNIYPNRVLVYNYRNGSWALNNDTITCWGYFEQQLGATWANSTTTWEESNFSWQSGTIQPQFRQIIAGNQEGFVFVIAPDISRNAAALQITNIQQVGLFLYITLMNHNLSNADYIALENIQGPTELNGKIYEIAVSDVNTIVIGPLVASTGYTGGGTAALVSPIEILSKQWNPYVDKARNVYVAQIDFGVQKTAAGQVTVDYYPSSSEYSMVQAGLQSGALMGTNTLETSPYAAVPFEQFQERLWHQLYFQTSGECIQLYIYMTFEQITNPAIAWSDFQLEGLLLHTMPTSDRLI